MERKGRWEGGREGEGGGGGEEEEEEEERRRTGGKEGEVEGREGQEKEKGHYSRQLSGTPPLSRFPGKLQDILLRGYWRLLEPKKMQQNYGGRTVTGGELLCAPPLSMTPYTHCCTLYHSS